MKKALVLSGGGTRGAYENGAIRALRELKQDDWDIVTGTSIGALNGTLVVQKDYEAMDDMWRNLTQEDIIQGAMSTDFNLETMINERNLVGTFFKNYVKEKGADVTPLIHKVNTMYRPDSFLSSPIDFGCITVKKGTTTPVYVTKEMMQAHGADWLLATSAAFPAFPIHKFEEGEFIDGGYFDNLPIDLALRMGADEVIAIDLLHRPLHPNYMHRSNITYIYPSSDIGLFLNFNRDDLYRRDRLGYLDTMKAFGKYMGVRYTFEPTKLPTFYREFERDIELLETRFRLANNFNEYLRSDQLVYDTILQNTNRGVLNDHDFFFGCMDCLMDLSGCDEQAIWTYTDARNAVLTAFKEVVNEDYVYAPSLDPQKMLNYATTLDQRGIVEKILHSLLYPEHVFLNENLLLTLYPFEEALATLLLYLLRELGDE